VPPAPPRARFARRPLRDIQHTHYHPQIVVWFVPLPLSLSLSLSLAPSVCYGVSRASYIFSGCITLHPRSPAPVPPLVPAVDLADRTAPVIYCPGVPEGPGHTARGPNFRRRRALNSNYGADFRDRLMFRRFIKTEKRHGSRRAVDRATERSSDRRTPKLALGGNRYTRIDPFNSGVNNFAVGVPGAKALAFSRGEGSGRARTVEKQRGSVFPFLFNPFFIDTRCEISFSR